MNDTILNDEQWSELWKAINLFDQKGHHTALNRVLGLCKIILILLRSICIIVSIMKNIVEYLDDDVQPNECNDVEKQLVITLIEAELAEIIAANGML
jgi:hypothetical protein